jgi:hypothetical protein
MRARALLLGSLALLFLLRVVGQILVAFLGVRFLPPLEDWYSGLLPYPILLPVQLPGAARGRHYREMFADEI